MINANRYDKMVYRRCGHSGILLPALSLGLWHNFGKVDNYENSKEMILAAFNLGITHFDLANNYGPPYGSAEETFGRVLKEDLKGYRDELLISTKAGWDMWPGPYGNFGSRKYLIASLDQSLKRMGLDYVDIFYSHRRDPETPLEETMGALASTVHQGKALYVGISSYNALDTKKAATILKNMGVPCLIHQPSYSMMNRWIEEGLTDVLRQEGIGSIAFCPLDQGLLTSKYLDGTIPEGSRASKEYSYLSAESITSELLDKIRKLNEVAKRRGQTLAQMALAWTLREGGVTSALIGASHKAQIEENVKALDNLEFSREELIMIDHIVKGLS
ncbi:L-glyceraldehyde 3-phosphate reductase [Zhenhengia yiwuensis]|uniref:L-glyceraldehyde 3-phosphate reductase n=2 Tax=Zhenhengia TaxID=2944196 RepID=UPI00290FA464|nr:L-glyceraldehyde 3-phosphate reductase [Zhenhengia yiwuensis]MDU6360232.1 L-glyceraldehyde 3-phosphate reductase [Clostridiales bacterium]MDY3368253.1 L-glyceraldehyde 3-phosphate reductase [Zhenhengia yiwuensis]